MSYDSELEAAGRHDAALARAEAWQARYEVERLAEEVSWGDTQALERLVAQVALDAERSERASRRRALLARFLGLT